MGRRSRGVGERRYVSCFQLIDSIGENRWCLCSLQEGSNSAVLVAKIEASISLGYARSYSHFRHVQVWLDVSQHPSRGREQADLIWRRVLARAFEAES